MSLNKKLQRIMLSLIIPLIVCIVGLECMNIGYIVRYEKITHNLTVCADFNNNFKENVDLKMYYYAVGSKYQTELPTEDVEHAIRTARSLWNTTESDDSKKALSHFLDYCTTLEERMVALSETKEYEGRQAQLENNIYVLTTLIEKKLTEYIYCEISYLALLEKKVTFNMKISIGLTSLLIAVITIYVFVKALRYTKSIINPINKLCKNVEKIGHGEFELPKVESEYYEISQLDAGIQKTAVRIEQLIQNVKEEEERQNKMQFQLLQAQINPHFLYNTLDTIVWLVESGKNQEAIGLLTDLSVFFRTALSKGEDIITLKDEVRHTESYMGIQQIRYRDILDYEINLPENLANIKIPKLTLQPLTENALYHGVKEKRGKSKIEINFLEQGEDVLIVIHDDGIGMVPEKLKELQENLRNGTRRSGFGVATVHERVKLYFGEKYGLNISSVYGEGTTVQVLIPKKFY